MTAIATGLPEITLIDLSGSQMGTTTNPFVVSSSVAPIINNINNITVVNGVDFVVPASFVLTSSFDLLPNSQVHQTLRELIHLVDEGPRGNAWPTSMFNESGPKPFITASIWWLPLGLNPRGFKVIEQLITRNSNTTPATIRWNVYAANGITIVESYVDTISYDGMFEISRTRTHT